MESPMSAFQMYRLKGPATPFTNGKAKTKKKKLSGRNNKEVLSNIPLEKSIIMKTKHSMYKKKQVGFINKKVKRAQEKLIVKKKSKNGSVQLQKTEKMTMIKTPEKSTNGSTPSNSHLKRALMEEDNCYLTDESVSSVLSMSEPIIKRQPRFMADYVDSSFFGCNVLEWLIAPYHADVFLNNVWEKSPLHIAREDRSYYKTMLSTPMIDNMLRTENIMYTKNIDITSYTDGKRETHNPVGRAHPHVVWDYYLNGCSIRLLNPQTYTPRLQLLNASLQEFFNSFVGANAYLTPPDSQGFAPHYDDIEALIMQIEGKKLWKVYRPCTEQEQLPRTSSRNFAQHEIGEPILEVTLQAGDMLYFPRGFIHQGATIEGEHSLHVTISFYQKHSWADLLEKMLPNALQAAIEDEVELRKGLPFDIYDHYGLVNSHFEKSTSSPRKNEIARIITSMVDKVKHHISIDQAVDEMAKRYQSTALPPVLTDRERQCTVYGDSDKMIENGKVTKRVEIDMDTMVRLVRKNIMRMVREDDAIKIYFHSENSLEYEGHEPQYLEIDEKFAPAIKTLVTTYPEYVLVEKLNIENDSDKIQIANDLWENGIIMTEYPMDTIDD